MCFVTVYRANEFDLFFFCFITKICHLEGRECKKLDAHNVKCNDQLLYVRIVFTKVDPEAEFLTVSIIGTSTTI